MVKDLCFEIIEKCPNNCKFCSSMSCIDKSRYIKFEDFKRVIDYFMNDGGIEELSLSGGEPFLHPDIFNMISYAKEYGIRTVIFSSGIKYSNPLSEAEKSLLEAQKRRDVDKVKKEEPDNIRLISNVEKYYDRFLNPPTFSSLTKEECIYLKSIGLDKIVFDFQASDPQTDALLMGRSTSFYNILLDSVLHASSANLDVDIHFIPMQPNYKEMKDVLELLEIPKIKKVSLLKFVPQGRGKENVAELQLSDQQLQEFLNLLDKAPQVYSGNIRLGNPLQGENTHKCTAGLEKIDIKFDGTILPCPAFKELSKEEYEKYGIKLYNIYENLEEVHIPGRGTRKEPLCQRVYKKNC